MSPEGDYAVAYLPAARRDLIDIVHYVAGELKNPEVAERLSNALIEGIGSLSVMPYRRPVYIPLRPLDHEFRSLRIENYLAFYWVDERERTVTVARVLYARSDVAAPLVGSR
ncbi:Plasmid stabilisation system protein [Collinsella sp. AK_207A]|uniref:type II toxin-antitoxin system RelE/ParE family toxin n=1 Tax=Collinsella sp. AK_207A TaxID=2650472 RepID=UPI00126128DB|nr:type II toxin-antitoxin system RelE/ParE family toxin [Collinsella sp. AK_207A]VWM02087.1 Plasmid stabilisation system protein [Collinsella sp. AK_207A]